MREVLLEDRTGPGGAVYDKYIGVPAYVFAGKAVQDVPTQQRRVSVPMEEDVDNQCDANIFTLVRTAAERGTWLDYEGTFHSIRRYFETQELPLHCVVQHPDLVIPVPNNVAVIRYDGMLQDRFYCLTRPELFGVKPRTPGLVINGIQCPDLLGYCIHTPKGILTAFLESAHSGE